jgi:hypothetical protein
MRWHGLFRLRCCITPSYWDALLHHAFLLARIRLTRTAAERGPVLFGERGQGTLLHHAFVLARIRLTRTAAERGPVLSGACGQ